MSVPETLRMVLNIAGAFVEAVASGHD